ncbi:MAG TPA: response regulator [Chitinophagaceae bacterium]|nr:response regulator [Chitinophagaceae bacterium]
MLKLKILLIDDEVDYCLIMKGYFTKKNYDVFIAYNLKEGLQLIDTARPDILFLDNNLPDGQGWAHVGDIVEKNPHLKIFLASAYHQRGDFLSPSPHVTVWEKPLSMTLLNATF